MEDWSCDRHKGVKVLYDPFVAATDDCPPMTCPLCAALEMQEEIQEEMQGEIDDTLSELDDAQAKNKKLESETYRLEARVEELEDQVSSLEHQSYSDGEDEVQELKDQLAQSEALVERLRGEIGSWAEYIPGRVR